MELLRAVAPYLALGVFVVVFTQMFHSIKRRRSRDSVKELEDEIARRQLKQQLDDIERQKRGMKTATCSGCGGNNPPDAISPHGDVKCTYCGNWFNIRG